MADSSEIKYDTPIEVTREQYQRVAVMFGQLIAHRKDKKGRYWIKLWDPRFKEELRKELSKP